MDEQYLKQRMTENLDCGQATAETPRQNKEHCPLKQTPRLLDK